MSFPFSSHDVVLRLGTDRALHAVTDPTTQLLINGILNIYNFIIAIVAGLLCDKVGRRPLFIASTVGESNSDELGHLCGKLTAVKACSCFGCCRLRALRCTRRRATSRRRIPSSL